MANKKRLIDANALVDEFRKYMVERYDREKCVTEENCKTCENNCLWRRMVSKAPTVDAVEVVRCKNCKHYDKGFCVGYHAQHGIMPDDFCSHGERKGGDWNG